MSKILLCRLRLKVYKLLLLNEYAVTERKIPTIVSEEQLFSVILIIHDVCVNVVVDYDTEYFSGSRQNVCAAEFRNCFIMVSCRE